MTDITSEMHAKAKAMLTPHGLEIDDCIGEDVAGITAGGHFSEEIQSYGNGWIVADGTNDRKNYKTWDEAVDAIIKVFNS
jgi:hypothetical protein